MFHMKRLFLLLVLLPIVSLGQNYSTSNSKAIKLFEKGQSAFYKGNVQEALRSFEQSLEIEPSFMEANIMLAEWYLDAKEPAKAKQHYYAVVNADPSFFTQAWLQIGNLELNDGNNVEAKLAYKQFLALDKKAKDRHAAAQKGIATADFRMEALAHPVAFSPVNLGGAVNSSNDEYLPAITVDGKTLIFTRRFPRNSSTVPGINEEEDFYVSTLQSNGWGQATRMAEPVNSHDNEGAQCISQDGRIMFFTACGRQDGAGRCDLYMCTRKGDKWSKPRNVGSPINTGAWESQPSFSIDGRTLYFVSDRKGGYGGLDIWKTVYGDRGWSEPENLGPSINTAGDEMSPFIHYDDRTLYFSSNGHVGMGGMDLFVSRRQEDGSWSKPENLGYPINTHDDETNLIVTADGRTAMYSSNREGGYGKQDLYSFILPEVARPTITVCMTGMVTDIQSGAKLSAQIQVIDLATGAVVATTSSDSQTGRYQISLPAGKDYAIHASAKGYLFYSQNYELDHGVEEDWKWQPDEVNIAMSRIEAGRRIALRNVFFATNKSEVLEESRVELDKLVEILKNNPTMRIELGGHTDNVGRPEDNQRLSESRAKAVYDYLVGHGIESSRMTYKGYGESQPVASNDTDEGRQKNRRTELKIL